MNYQNPEKVLIIIPARIKSKRFPCKVLADINGLPMIVHTAIRAREANIGRVIVAVDHEETRDFISRAGFESAMTRTDHKSGSDRIFEALNLVDKALEATIIVNIQGDLPTIEPEAIAASLIPLRNPHVDIGTIAINIPDDEDTHDPNIVKIIATPSENGCLKSLYFTRSKAPYGAGPFYRHLGIYAYRRKALERFSQLSPSVLEKRESLEQLRALENGMRIDVKVIYSNSVSVDVQDDLEKARILLDNPLSIR
ncbi:3-deoxy-manno-octulosonate cytidylyltransferase [Candidatus Liberibacter sp.]|uniref:3-deoxy-manno-octulosonate cytidylyltransferase n=1 Tax=Candidatus Liberibacter sp. TaxID=34022 RepID=UPI0015F416A0|nr:3-deoxy-manno-octulosonate cytidylyltransferase [Candidatus Liberibacter sp.]MBA5724438.1 3-deoxy-manno-octulosonate cytidylyltransferase [Candidatus Liberibacter sp.]